MDAHKRQAIEALRDQARAMAQQIEKLLLLDECVGMAYRERTGAELQPGEWYTANDAERALEIALLYPTNDR